MAGGHCLSVYITGILPSLIIWELWKERNNRRHGEKRRTASSIIECIKTWVRELPFPAKVGTHGSVRDGLLLQCFGFSAPSPRRKRPIPVYRCPPFVSVKLNVDGACRGNPDLGGGGGIIRDRQGEVLVAFSNFYGPCTNSLAKLRALRDGLKLCKVMGLMDEVVNYDLEATVKVVSLKRCSLWGGWYYFKEILELVASMRAHVSFAFWESNWAADWLTSLSCDTETSARFQPGSMPLGPLQGILRENKAGLPVLRS
ncbi:uncharacterized protein LOC122644825 [Telopea speciosissima]|uniref:uncharacterized protein LOC122644825 n=1 Tax=Telopea speciosissima TaxID=54955 RepID=UPI001CC5AA8F|nr:uncharacterized protein LOC122644825 [Telopea speciosissima]